MNVNITGPRILAEFSFFGLCDVTITQTTLTSLLVLAAVTILCWRLGRNLRKRPGRMQAVTERAVLAVYKLVDDTMGTLRPTSARCSARPCSARSPA